MTVRKPIPAALAGPSFSVGAAQRLGVPPGRLRGPDLSSPFFGIRVPAVLVPPPLVPFDFAAATRSVIALAHQYAPRLKPGQFFCEMTAIALHGLPIPTARLLEREVHVAVPFPRTPPRARGMIGHQFSVNVLATREGLPVSAAVDAWIDCARRCTVAELVVIGDGLVRRQQPVATGYDLAKAVTDHHNRPGSIKLNRALALIRPGSDSPKETELRLLILASGLPEPEVNLTICDANGELIAICDLAYPEWMVLVEYQGAHHFTRAGEGRRDIDRIAALEDAGWKVIQVHNGHLTEQNKTVITRIRTALLAAGWKP